MAGIDLGPPALRRIGGLIAFPPGTPATVAWRLWVEVRDVSRADAPSTLLGRIELDHVPVGPGAAVSFAMDAPEVAVSRSLALRVQVDLRPRVPSFSGDYLSTVLVPVPATGDAPDLVVPLRATAD